MAWEKANGRPVPRGMHVHHLCSQTRCSNPEHLELRTPADNVRESRAAKLTAENVREIKSSPLTSVALGKKFGVTPYTVRNVRKGLTWKGVE